MNFIFRGACIDSNSAAGNPTATRGRVKEGGIMLVMEFLNGFRAFTKTRRPGAAPPQPTIGDEENDEGIHNEEVEHDWSKRLGS
jgi:hypothetical protein